MPNGRRHTLKVNLDSSVLQILEDVCSKHGFNPDEYSLKHHNTVLDPTSVVRFCSLPNNAFLEMVQNKRQLSSTSNKVILSLQVDGESERFTGEFPSDANLESILSSLYPRIIENDKDKVPVVVYMRREVVGMDAMRSTTLRSLGLTSGRALLRLSMRESETHPELQFTGTTNLGRSSASQSAGVCKEEQSERSFGAKECQLLSDRKPTFSSQSIPAAEIVTAAQLVDNVINSARSDNESLIIERNKQMAQSIENPVRDNQATNWYKSKENKKESSPPRNIPSPVPMDITSTRNSEPAINLDEIKFLEEHNGLVFPLDESNSSFNFEVPDSFFDITLDDLKLMMRDLKRNRESMENAPLQTEALRRLEKENKFRTYNKTVVRVQFPDRYILQGVFSPNDMVAEVANFVKRYIRETNREFCLYTSPPKKILPLTETLLDVGCVPSAKIYFAFTDQSSEMNFSKFFLDDKVLPFIVSQKVASVAAGHVRGISEDKNRVKLKDYNSSDSLPSGSGANKKNECLNNKMETSGARSLLQPSPSTSSNEVIKQQSPKSSHQGKVPKWFKPV